MDVWISVSNPGRQTLLSAVSSLVGLFLMLKLRDFSSAGSNAGMGFLLGVLLLIIGLAGLLRSGRQTITVDPRARRIVVKDEHIMGTKVRSIPFDEVCDVKIGYLGKKSNFVTWYYLILTLKNGKTYPLFSPGRFYPGGSDRISVDSWRRRLVACLEQQADLAPRG